VVYLASILGYGDCLISLSLLEGIESTPVQVVGSAIVRQVAPLLRQPPPAAELDLSGHAAFYLMRSTSPLAAWRDFRAFRRWSTHTLKPGDTLILEKPDRRNRFLVPRGCRVVDVPRTGAAYADRAAVLEPWIGRRELAPAPAAQDRPRSLLINPGARMRFRMLPPEVVEQALRLAAEGGVAATLVDVDGSYAHLAALARSYLRSPPLAESAAALRAADRFLGTDSFFMHLAYYYRVPQLAFFHAADIYFTPPGLAEAGGRYFFGDIADRKRLQASLNRLISPA
jgi:hypothetical protein